MFWAAGSYVALGPGSSSVGTFIAYGYVALTNAAVSGAVFSLTAGTTLTVSAVRLPSSGALTLWGPAYNIPVNLLSASGFAVLGGSAIVNTGPSSVLGNVGCYPGDSDQISVRLGCRRGVICAVHSRTQPTRRERRSSALTLAPEPNRRMPSLTSLQSLQDSYVALRPTGLPSRLPSALPRATRACTRPPRTWCWARSLILTRRATPTRSGSL